MEAADAKRTRAVVGLLRASHLQPTLAVTGFTVSLAVGERRRWGAVTAGAAVLAGQLCVGWSNDFIDRHRDRLAERNDKPIVAGDVSAAVVRNSAIGAGLVCIPLSLLSGKRAGAVHLGALTSALAYNLRLKRTVFSVAPYVVAFGSLPAFVSLGGPRSQLPVRSATIAAALMGAGAHFVNTLPDLDADAATGVAGLPQRLGETRSMIVGAALLGGAAAVVATGGPPLGPSSKVLAIAAEASAAGVLVAAATRRGRAAWSMALATAGTTVALYLRRAAALR